jgi:hypothetical protein
MRGGPVSANSGPMDIWERIRYARDRALDDVLDEQSQV